MHLLILACMVLATTVTNVRSTVPAIFYPYGTANGDSIAPINDDGATPPVNLSGIFPFFGQSRDTAYVSTNGILSFDGPVPVFTPNPFPIQSFPVVAPFWADVDTTRNNGRVYYRGSLDSSLLARVTQDISSTFPPSCLSSFRAKFVFLATWENVTYFGGNATTPVDTFQCLLVSDAVHSFAIFNYASTVWTTGVASGGNPNTGLGGTPAQVGFNAGDGTNYFAVPGSRTPAIVNISSMTNVNQAGRFMFRVDLATISLFTCDACQSHPCQNSATCTDVGVNSFTCTCPAGFTGTLCETNINECSSSPCQNGGTCIDGVNSYTCNCAPGYTGALCQSNINECNSSPCQNGGTCVNGVNSFTCNCLPGYTGTLCQTDINECSSSPCQNGGTCIDGVNSFTCNCVPGYTGALCQSDINECSSNPCQNGGNCVDGMNRFTCVCLAGYTGILCQTDINECSSNPCQNGGTCIDGVNSFTCNCLPGYTGILCQSNIDYCHSHPCQNGAICVNVANGYNCVCPDDFFGYNCHLQYDCTNNNPCTPANAALNKFYFPNTDPHHFVQCSEWGQCYIMPCANPLVWDPVAYTCNYPPGSPGYVPSSGHSSTGSATGSATGSSSGSTPGSYDCGNNNPCTPGLLSHFYYPNANPNKYVQCSQWGQCYIMPCPAGMIWNANINTCINHGGRKRRHVRKYRSK